MRIAVPKRWFGLVFILLTAFAVDRTHGDTFDFSNTNSITINNDNNPPTIATPYPSSIAVSGLNGQIITNVTVTLNGFTHPFPSDVSILLVGPQGQMSLLISDVGGAIEDLPVTNLTIGLDDNSPYSLPVNDMLYSGTFHPTAGSTPLFFSFPAPVPPGNSNAPAMLSVFDGTDPDGAWNLFVVDDFEEVTNGYISGGWSLSVSTGIPLKLANSSTNVVLSWPVVSGHTFTVQFSPSITNTTNTMWSNLSTLPVNISGRYVVTNTKVGKAQFFRLLVQ